VKPRQPRLTKGKNGIPTEIYIDGASRGNPGNSGLGILIKDKNKDHRIKKYLGILTNNQAEYSAFITALEFARKLKKDSITIYTDSLLLANQINGIWQVESPNIKPLYEKAKKLLGEFKQVEVRHIPRELNREADRLANEAIDEYAY
jgi:ribonuclease HI